MKILLTGGTGFIGSRLVKTIEQLDLYSLILVVRNLSKVNTYDSVCVNENNDWIEALCDVDVVIHMAARAHITHESASDPMAEFRRCNVNHTVELARVSAASGVRRFIFISSIGVNGNTSAAPFTETDKANPSDKYAISKWEAEQALWDVHRNTGMEIVIIRPPLVYGPNAPGNFGSLVRWIDKGFPLPLGAINNLRSLVGLDNLVDLIITCIDHPAASNEVFLAGDGQDLSTTELLQRVAQAMDKPLRLIPVPESLLMLGATVLGKRAVMQKLLGSLQVDISKARDLLGWEPSITVEEGLRRCFQSLDRQ